MARRLIQDEFTDAPVSRQLRYQLRHRRDGKCNLCPEPAVPGMCRCAKHLVLFREHLRAVNSARRRYLGAKSYKLAESGVHTKAIE